MDNAGEYVFTTDRDALDIDVIYRFLSNESYWARCIRREVVAACVRNSFCLGVLHERRLVAFGRVVTDYATYGHVMDVFVLPEHRGRGLGKRMMERMVAHPDLQGFRLWTLGTADAHSLYARYGFAAPAHPERWMERRDADLQGRTSRKAPAK